MIVVKQKQSCSGCKACFNICPKNCIEMLCDEEGFWYPYVDEEKCSGCNLCEKVCPHINGFIKDVFEGPIVYAAWNKEEKTREISSSGGMFTIFSEYIIKQNRNRFWCWI